jgi:hypothetical protein
MSVNSFLYSLLDCKTDTYHVKEHLTPISNMKPVKYLFKELPDGISNVKPVYHTRISNVKPALYHFRQLPHSKIERETHCIVSLGISNVERETSFIFEYRT